VPVVVAETLAGHAIVGPEGAGSGWVGELGDESPPPHPTASSNTGSNANRAFIN
jgi:hypothetical protein